MVRGMLLLGLVALWPLVAWAAPPALPDPTLFGDGWTMTGRSSGPADRPVWNAAGYAGPRGARIIMSLIDASDPVVMRDGWSQTTQDAQQLIYKLASGKAGPTAPLAGCGSIVRTIGLDPLDNDFGVGYTGCADDANHRIFVVVTSGQVFGKTGTDASDAVVTAILRQAGATPVP